MYKQPQKHDGYKPPKSMSLKELCNIACFSECDACASRPGSPYLCSACLHNRDLITTLQRALK